MIPTGGTIASRSVEEVTQPALTWKLDFEKGRAAGMTDGLEALKQAVFMIMQTERYKYLIYSFNYGVELEPVIGNSPTYVQSEIARRIREALEQDDRIKEIKNMNVAATGDGITASFTVESGYGSFEYSQGVV